MFLGKDPKDAYTKIHKEIKEQYPGHILNEEDLQWIFMNAGGWMGSMCLLHASLTEYVLFFGSAVDTVGHSGNYIRVKLSANLIFIFVHNLNGTFIYTLALGIYFNPS